MILRRLIPCFCGFVACLSAQPRVYSVCEILNRLGDFSCRNVRVKARLESDVDTWLAGEECSKHVEVSGVKFDDLIALKWPISLLVGCKVGFKHDDQSLSKVRAVLKGYDPKKQRIEVLLDGVIETRNPAYALLDKGNGKFGFGHLGMAPAQIIVEKVLRIDIAQRK